jgi:ATP-dependent DNA helicase RecG
LHLYLSFCCLCVSFLHHPVYPRLHTLSHFPFPAESVGKPIFHVSLELMLFNSPLESNRIEYKAASHSDVRHHLRTGAIRAACAFANDLEQTRGGILLVGVAEQKGVPVCPPSGISIAEADNVMAVIQQDLRVQIVPPVCARVGYDRTAGMRPGFVVIIVSIPASPHGPHRVGGKCLVRENNECKHSSRETEETVRQLCCRRIVEWDAEESLCQSFEALNPHRVKSYFDRRELGATVTRLNLSQQLSRLNLLGLSGWPCNAAVLFFHTDPATLCPGFQIEISYCPESIGGSTVIRNVVKDTALEMVEAALGIVDTYNAIIVNKNDRETLSTFERRGSGHIRAFPKGAISEAVVNAIVHRSYVGRGARQPIKILITSRILRVQSFPGAAISQDITEGGVKSPFCRHPVLLDLFKGVSLAEAIGSGIPRMFESASKNGNAPPEFVANEELFQVSFHAHPSSEIVPGNEHSGAAFATASRFAVLQPGPSDLQGRTNSLDRDRGSESESEGTNASEESKLTTSTSVSSEELSAIQKMAAVMSAPNLCLTASFLSLHDTPPAEPKKKNRKKKGKKKGR